MKNKLVNIKLHGILGQQMKKEEFKLAVKSVGEAMHAINTLTKQKLYRCLHGNDQKGIKYEVLINERPAMGLENIDPNNLSTVQNTELAMQNDNLKTIDIVPVIEGGDDIASILTIVVGVVLIVAGIFTFGSTAWAGAALIMGGIGLVAAGVINLLTKPPKFDEFREIGGGGRRSYLFNGPTQTVGEGGPVPVGYGRLVVGSHVISTSYTISDVNAAEEELTI